jgi:site-specific DNA-methyltransferase (adenine-specific)
VGLRGKAIPVRRPRRHLLIVDGVDKILPLERVQLGQATLYRGDARELLSDLAGIDVIVTDPVWPNCPAGLIPGSEDPYGLWQDAMTALPPVERLVTVLRADCDPRFLAPVPDALPFFGALQLPYVMPHYLGRAMGGDELAFWFGSPIAWAAGRRVVPGRGPVAQPIHRPNNGHPNSRAQIHIDWLVGWCSDNDQTVCDPFMGSGTTGVACIKLGRPFVGIEIEPRYFDLACRRIDDAMRQGDLFSSRTPASEIETPRLF